MTTASALRRLCRPYWRRTRNSGTVSKNGGQTRIDRVFERLEPRVLLDGGSIHGVKFFDVDGDGQQGPNEPGLPGVVIYLDANRNGELDEDETQTRTTEAGDGLPAGRYWFSPVDPGEHVVREVVPDGFEQTFPAAGFHVVTVDSNQAVDGVDFGNQPVEPGAIRGRKFNDLNGNGEMDANEPGIAGVTVYLDLNDNGELDEDEPRTLTSGPADPTTPNTGYYAFAELLPGDYIVREVVPDGFVQTFPVDAHRVSLESGEAVHGLNFGNQDTRESRRRFDFGTTTSPVAEGFTRVTQFTGYGGNSAFGWIAGSVKAKDRGQPDDLRRDFNAVHEALFAADVTNGLYDVQVILGDAFRLRDRAQLTIEGVQLDPVSTEAGEFLTLTTRVRVEDGQLTVLMEDLGGLSNRMAINSLTITPAPPPHGVVAGLKWNDLNGDGDRQNNEPALGGVIIYADLNHNGELDDNEPRTVSRPHPLTPNDVLPDELHDITDVAARVNWWMRLPQGEYALREVVPDGFEQRFPDDAHHVGLAGGQVVLGLDFGNHNPPDPGAIHGFKWHDLNGDGQRTNNEPGLGGVTVYLDLNRNGEPDPGEPRTQTTHDDTPGTNGSIIGPGHYWFSNVEPGEYVVREVVPDGFRQTFPHDGFHVVHIEDGDIIDGVDFGNRRLPTHGVVAGLKWNDLNGDGERQNNEPALGGVIIYADLNHNGELDDEEPHTVSRPHPLTANDVLPDELDNVPEVASRVNWWMRLPQGEYALREVVPDGFEQTFPEDAHHVGLAGGQVVLGLDFGNHNPPDPGAIHGFKWHDLNGDGERQSNEPGLGGVTVYLDLNNNGEPDPGEPRTQTTHDDTPGTNGSIIGAGHYWFSNVEPGEYVVREVVPEGFVQTFPHDGFHVVHIEDGDIVDGVDFGNKRLPTHGVVAGLKWNDLNGDGERQNNEPALGGVIIYADLNHNGELDDNEPHTVSRPHPLTPNDVLPDELRDITDVAARVNWWMRLPQGEYALREVVPDGFEQTFPEDAHHVGLAGGQVVLGLDFGNHNPPDPGVIHGFKWHDLNGDGQRTNNEPGLGGVTVYLDLNNNGEPDAGEPRTETTHDDASGTVGPGHYWFSNVEPGEYVVREVVPDGFVQTFPHGGFHVVHIEDGDIVDGVDFGNRRLPTHGVVAGLKWNDLNGDGERQNGEPALGGVIIYADLNHNGELDNEEPRTVSRPHPLTPNDVLPDELRDVTDVASRVNWWMRLPQGEYALREVVPDGYEQTFPEDAHHVGLPAGEVILGLDFGNHNPPDPGAIHGFTWHDLNGDGQRTNNEPGLGGVTVYLDLNNNGEPDPDEPRTQTTHDDTPGTNGSIIGPGHYWFSNVEPGEYVVREVVPEGFRQTFPHDGFHVVHIEDGDIIDGVDFGNRRLPTHGVVAGLKWNDLNGDGERQNGEPALGGVVIYADLNDNGVLDQGEPRTESRPHPLTPNDVLPDELRDVTDVASRVNWWMRLPQGEYALREVVPDGYEQTFPEDAHHVGLAAGQVVLGLDFGNTIPTRRFDFGTLTSPVEEGFSQVADVTAYNETLSFGWFAGSIKSKDRGQPDDLRRDFNAVFEAVFVADLVSGWYDVEIVVGDAIKLRDEAQLTVEGTVLGPVTTQAGEFRTLTTRVLVDDGQLTVLMEDLGGVSNRMAINAMTVTPVLPTN